MARPADWQRSLDEDLQSWREKPLLREIYAGFHEQIRESVTFDLKGSIVEIGSGIGNLKPSIPAVISTDVRLASWLDAVVSGYSLPFQNGTLSNIILFDVFHHIQYPRAFLAEAHRVLVTGGRLIILDPFISMVSSIAYGLFHPEPVLWNEEIDERAEASQPLSEYAAQGNATRLFFRRTDWPNGWRIIRREALTSFTYLLSGGFSRPPLYPGSLKKHIQQLDQLLSRWPRLFAARCLIVLTPEKEQGSDPN